jgi:hypothetical protein
MKSAPCPPSSILPWSRAVGLLSLRVCPEMSRRPPLEDADQLLAAVGGAREGIEKVTLQAVFLEWMDRSRKCITTNGEYTE